jgi:hypothetical protein
MSSLLDKALEKIVVLPPDEKAAIASEMRGKNVSPRSATSSAAWRGKPSGKTRRARLRPDER